MSAMFNTANFSSRWCTSHGRRFVAMATCGTLAIVTLCYSSSLTTQVAALAAYVGALAGLLIAGVERNCQEHLANMLQRIEIPLGLAPDHEMFRAYRDIADSLARLAQQTDPVLREIAVFKLTSICGETQALADGTVVFPSTETWRTVYQKLLLSVSVKAYLSVAWVKTADYWRDVPGQRSLRLNHELVDSGYRVERVVIVNDQLWPPLERLPRREILSWLKEQSDHGIHLHLVRESGLSGEPDLLSDFGIYGTQAVGEQELDDCCRTLRFNLRFDKHSIQLAHNRWERLSLYTTKLSDLLDQGS